MQTLRMVLARSAAAAVATALCACAGVVLAQSRTDIHRDAATRNVGDDAFMMKYSRAFYCNLPDDNNQIVLASRGCWARPMP